MAETPSEQTPAAPRPVLAARGISKRFGAVQALADIDFEVHRHEVVAIVGDNGAGKSTLAKVLGGVYQADAGQLLFDGEPVSIPSPAAAHGLGIATVFQSLALCDNLDVVANVFLGREKVKGVALDEPAMEELAWTILRQLTTTIVSLRAPVSTLSAGQRQSVAIARALLGEPKVVLMDEPTSSLSVAQTAEVLNMIERLRELDHGVVLISHNLVDVQSVADRIVVLRHGRNNGSFVTDQVSYEELLSAITGARVSIDVPLWRGPER